VNTRVIVDTEPGSSHEGVPGIIKLDAISRASSVESWLDKHLDALALAVVAAGFAVRVLVAGRSYLNPDEALHYMLINQSSAFLAYKASIAIAHPPLLFLLLYFWHFLGHSELMLRLPSVFAGAALCWMVFKWIGIVLGRTASLIGLIIVTFSPALIALSAEVREYALLLFCTATAMYFLERAFQEKSVSQMCYFSIFLYLAILTHYSALFFTVAIGLYSLTRISDSHFPRKVVVAWASGQAGALAIYGFLYVTQVSKLKGAIAAWGSGFGQSYFQAGSMDIFTFTWRNTSNIFLFMFEQPYLSQAILLFIVVGVLILFVRDLVSRRGNPQPSHLGILLVLPFIAIWGAAIAGKYPYVGSRHTVVLAPFAIAGVSFLLATVCRQKLSAGLVIAALLMAASNASGDSMERGITREDQSRTQMIAAVNQIHQSIPRSDLILVDMQSSFPIVYYLCDPREINPTNTVHGPFNQFSCDGYSIVSFPVWKLAAVNFLSQFEKMARTYGLKSGDQVWVFQSGWGVNLDTDLPSHLQQFRCLTPKSFGANLSVIPFVVGPDFLPAEPLTSCGK